MRRLASCFFLSICTLSVISLSSCSSMSDDDMSSRYYPNNQPAKPLPPPDYKSRIPSHIETSEKVVVVDPREHVWGAYNADGSLQRAGLATAGSDWCDDLGRSCHTKIGTFRIFSQGTPSCKSKRFPLGRGGAPMPYCMYFSGGYAMHGSPSSEVVDGNISHGCVRMHVEDAEWLRYSFTSVGTKVIVKSY